MLRRLQGWAGQNGRVALLEDFADDEQTKALVRELHALAQTAASSGRPFFAVFIDPTAVLGLPELYQERKPSPAA